MPSASPFPTLPLDRGAERAVAALRLTAALSVTAGAIWLALLRPSPIVWVCIAAAAAAALAWLVMGLRAGRRIKDADRHRLVLEPSGLRLIEGPRERRIAWPDVERIEADEERLVLRVSVRGGEPLVIEPRYGRLGVHDLEAVVRRAFDAAQGGPGPLQSAPL